MYAITQIRTEAEMEEFPCPSCDESFYFIDELYTHVLSEHPAKYLLKMMEKDMTITKEDFTQVDSSWVYVVDGFQLTLGPDANGDFKLHVMGILENLPPATTYPTEPEWETALLLANKFKAVHDTAKRRTN